jgi:hypothetical protein
MKPVKTGPLYQESADYIGALVLHGSYRFAVSPNGKRYLWQSSEPDGDAERFVVRRHRKKLSDLLPDLPSSVSQFVESRFPEKSADFDRPWASLLTAQSLAVRETRYDNDIYGGVIVAVDDLRLVFIAAPDRFCLQVRAGAGSWKYVSSSVRSEPLLELLAADLPASHKVAPFSGVPLFVDAVSALPVHAADYSGPRPKRFVEAFSLSSCTLAAFGPVSPPVRLFYRRADPISDRRSVRPPIFTGQVPSKAELKANRLAASAARRVAIAARRAAYSDR